MKWLTKSDYLKFLIHPAYLWVAKYAKDTLPSFDETAQANVAQANAVEAMAAQLFPGAHLIDVPLFDGPDESARLMRSGGPGTLLQPSVLTARKLYARCDILVRRDALWDLYELKGSTSVKPAHLLDLAFQRYVLEEAGYAVGRSFVITIDPDYVRDGPLEPRQLLRTTDVTEQVEPLTKHTATKVEAALEVMALETMPDDAPQLAGDWYGYRDVYARLHPDLPTSSIYKLTRLNLDQIKLLADLGVSDITNIPDSVELKPQQIWQRDVARTAKPQINYAAITEALQAAVYPLYYLDYETFASALPMWNGVRPFQQLPFQYSVHVVTAPGEPPVHYEYLARGGDYPIPELLAHLRADIGQSGSVIVWNKAFEMKCNADMASLHPEFAEFLTDLNTRIFDLMEIFSNGLYTHPMFQGSASIKKVLPALVPELSYKDLGITEGLTAQIRWMKAARGELDDAQAQKVYRDLVTYCGQDTIAMVRIFEVLRNTI